MTLPPWTRVELVGCRVREVLLMIPNMMLDEVYDRLDLWDDRATRTADHAKVRNTVLYIVVAGIMLMVARRSTNLSLGFFEVLILMLGVAAGERVAIAAFSAWGGRGVADAGVGSALQTLTPQQRRTLAVDAGESGTEYSP